MKILKYTPEIQKQLKSKIEAAPWMHIGFDKDGNYSIWVWDTREVLESGSTSIHKSINGKKAIDNNKPLKGDSKLKFDKSGAYATVIIDRWHQYAEGITGIDRRRETIQVSSKKELDKLVKDLNREQDLNHKNNKKFPKTDYGQVGAKNVKFDVNLLN